MTRADNTRHLAQAAASRHQATLTKASNTIERLDRSGQPVTFSAVAAAAGVSRTWLYRNPSVRDLITRLRTEPSQPASTPAAQRATAESLRALWLAQRLPIRSGGAPRAVSDRGSGSLRASQAVQSLPLVHPPNLPRSQRAGLVGRPGLYFLLLWLPAPGG